MNHKLRCAVGIVLAAALLGSGVLSVRVGAQGGPAYVGAAGCICHADPIQSSWQQSAHARAFELVKLAGEEENEKCLGCHTTGYGKGGYGESEAGLEGVQCEACHGPAGEHVNTMDKTKVQRTPSALVCAGCHQDWGLHSVP